MDEPFGAVDPLARDRLQDQFRRIQAELRKTVVFVTHDIDEAVRLGDRIAMLGPAGKLQQYTDPATLLAAPANEEVAAFVGADRGIRRMSVTSLSEADLDQPPTVAAGQVLDGAPDGTLMLDQAGAVSGVVRGGRVVPAPPAVALGTSLRDVFAALAGVDAGFVPVTADGRSVGVVTPDGVYRALRRSAHGVAQEAEQRAEQQADQGAAREAEHPAGQAAEPGAGRQVSAHQA